LDERHIARRKLVGRVSGGMYEGKHFSADQCRWLLSRWSTHKSQMRRGVVSHGVVVVHPLEKEP
jgi:hypothetical protein